MSDSEKFKLIADNYRTTLSARVGIDLEFNRTGVEYIEGYIKRVRDHLTEENKDSLSVSVSCFIGESLKSFYEAGEWKYFDSIGSWGVSFGEKGAVFPFSRVMLILSGSDEPGLLEMFDSVLMMFSEEEE